MKALLIFHTITGHTKQAVEDIAKGLEKKDINFEILNVKDIEQDKIDFNQYQILIIGTPTHVGGPARKISKFVDKLTPNDLENKRIGLVSCYALFGGNSTVNKLEKKLRKKSSNIQVEKIAVMAGAPGSLWKGPDASEKDVQKCVSLGEKLGE